MLKASRMIRLDVVINISLSAFLSPVSSLSKFLKLQGAQNSFHEILAFKITPKYRTFIFRGLIFNDIIPLILESLNLVWFWISHLKRVSVLLFECNSIKVSFLKRCIIPPPFWFLSYQSNMRMYTKYKSNYPFS